MIRDGSTSAIPASRFARYDDLIFLPLDLPPPPVVDPDRFVEWMASDPLRTGTFPSEHYRRLTGRPYPWLMRVLRDDFAALREVYPEVLDYALSYPLVRVQNIIFLAQDGDQAVFTHTDSDGLVGLRFYLANRNSDGLHFFRGRERYDYFNTYQRDEQGRPIPMDFNRYFRMEEKVYATFPEGVRSYVLNSARAAHGVDPNTCRLGERIAVLVQGEIDVPRYEAIVERSLSRYGDRAIWYDRAPG